MCPCFAPMPMGSLKDANAQFHHETLDIAKGDQHSAWIITSSEAKAETNEMFHDETLSIVPEATGRSSPS